MIEQKYLSIILLEVILDQFVFILQGTSREIPIEGLAELLTRLSKYLDPGQDKIVSSKFEDFEERVKENFRVRFENVIIRLDGNNRISKGVQKDLSSLLWVVQWVLMEFEMYRNRYVWKIGRYVLFCAVDHSLND